MSIQCFYLMVEIPDRNRSHDILVAMSQILGHTTSDVTFFFHVSENIK